MVNLRQGQAQEVAVGGHRRQRPIAAEQEVVGSLRIAECPLQPCRLLLEHFAFKGGTCIRKVHLGATGRFSMDLDFTACKAMDAEAVVLELGETFNRADHDINYALDLGKDGWRIPKPHGGRKPPEV